MLHLGDITKIKGDNVPIVDCVIFGAPCQDLSVAGKREGMKHEAMGDDETTRSGLFHEAIRIIKEMREKDARDGRTNEHIRPRYAVYENVPGAFSSNKGEDFRIVLEETAKVIDKDAVIPMPKKTNGTQVDASWEMGGQLLGEYSMHSFGESPKEDVESHLLQILEENPHPKYYLSAKACQGILTRAERRGKELPSILKEALEYMIRMESHTQCKNEQDVKAEEKVL